MPDYLSIKDAARRMGVKPKEIRRRIKDGELEGFVRLPGGAFAGPEDAGDFGPAAPNRRSAPPPEREVHVQRLEETVLVLQGELNARRQEVEELHVLLREIKDGLAAQAAQAAQAAATAASAGAVESAPAAATAPTAEAAAAAPAEPEIDWSAYDAESEQLRATMGRLEALLEQLETPEPEPKPEPEPEPAPAPPSATTAEAPAPTRPRPAARTPATEDDGAPTGDALARRREKLGVSREALAAFARVSWGFITEVESGRRKDPRSRQRLAAVLDAWQKRLAEERKKAATPA